MRLVAACFSLVVLLLREATTTTATTITQMQPEPASAGAHVLPSPFEQPERCRPQGSSAAAAAGPQHAGGSLPPLLSRPHTPGARAQGCAAPLPEPIKVVGCGSCGVDYLASVAAYPRPDEKLRTDTLEVRTPAHIDHARPSTACAQPAGGVCCDGEGHPLQSGPSTSAPALTCFRRFAGRSHSVFIALAGAGRRQLRQCADCGGAPGAVACYNHQGEPPCKGARPPPHHRTQPPERSTCCNRAR